MCETVKNYNTIVDNIIELIIVTLLTKELRIKIIFLYLFAYLRELVRILKQAEHISKIYNSGAELLRKVYNQNYNSYALKCKKITIVGRKTLRN